MKKLLPLLMCAALAGCLTTKSNKVGVKGLGSPDLAAEAKLAEKLPIVTPDSVNPQNYAAKVREFEDELTRDSRRMDAARNVADAKR